MEQGSQFIHFLDYWRVIQSRKEIIISVLLLVVMTGVGLTYTMPKTYEASTKIKIERQKSRRSLGQEVFLPYDPYFLPTQYEIIQSRRVIYEVIQNLNLLDAFSERLLLKPTDDPMQVMYETVQRSMKVRQYRDTKLIEIKMRLSDPEHRAPELTALIANEIAKVFHKQRNAVATQEAQHVVDAMSDAWQKEKKHVALIAAEVQALIEKSGIIVEGDSRFFERIDSLDAQTHAVLASAWIEAFIELQAQQHHLDKIKSLEESGDKETLLSALAYIVGDSSIASIRLELTKQQTEMESLLKSLGRQHPRVVEQEAAINELARQVEVKAAGAIIGLEAAYEAAVATHSALEIKLAATKDARIADFTTDILPYKKKKEELDRRRLLRDQLEARYTEEKLILDQPRSMVEVIESAVVPGITSYVSPNMVLNVILSVILGLGAGTSLAYFVEYLDTSVKTVEDIEQYIGTSVLGIIPQRVQPLIEEGPSSPHAEAYRVLRQNLRLPPSPSRGHAITVTSGGVGEGKSLSLFNLAYICATLGDRVLMIDSDMRRPRQHTLLNVPNDRGLAEVLFGDLSVSDAIIETEVPNLYFMPAGRLATEHFGVLDAERVRILCDALKKQFDFVMFDAPPIMGVSDASVLAGQMDGVLLVIQHRKHPRDVALRAATLVEKSGGNLLGVVLNNINLSRDHSYYYQTYYSTYSTYSGKRQKKKKSAPKKTSKEKTA